jgi:DNA end-binding protein Ku
VDAYFGDIETGESDEEMVALATELIERKTQPFDPKAFKDSYAEALKALVERKREGHAVVTTGEEERRAPGKVINLIEALKRSVGEGAEASGRRRAARGKSAAPSSAGRSKATATAKKTGPAKKRA